MLVLGTITCTDFGNNHVDTEINGIYFFFIVIKKSLSKFGCHYSNLSMYPITVHIDFTNWINKKCISIIINTEYKEGVDSKYTLLYIVNSTH